MHHDDDANVVSIVMVAINTNSEDNLEYIEFIHLLI